MLEPRFQEVCRLEEHSGEDARAKASKKMECCERSVKCKRSLRMGGIYKSLTSSRLEGHLTCRVMLEVHCVAGEAEQLLLLYDAKVEMLVRIQRRPFTTQVCS